MNGLSNSVPPDAQFVQAARTARERPSLRVDDEGLAADERDVGMTAENDTCRARRAGATDRRRPGAR
jgi:hypothetical protein